MDLIDQAFALHQAGRLADAERLYKCVLADDSCNFDALHMLGTLYAQRQDFEEAERFIKKAVSIDDTVASSLHNYGNVLAKLDRPEEAIGYFDRAVEISPHDAVIQTDRGRTLKELGRIDEAVACFGRASKIDPDLTDLRLDLGSCHLLRGDYERGWETFGQWRWDEEERRTRQRRNFPQPMWRGIEPVDGKVILLHSEVGYGDAFQFCRYARLLHERGAKVVLEVQPPLHHLLAGLEGTARVVMQGDSLPAFDCHCSLLSLPFAFRTTAEDIPAEVPYLFADPSRVAIWKQRLGDHGLKIGICWQASNNRKSLAVSDFHGLSRCPGVRLINLQKGSGSEQLARLPEGMALEHLGEEFDAGPHAFADTAAIIDQLDLVMTCDTSIAHLAGALNRPVWVALNDVPDWRWGLKGNASPWYPAMRLFRQKSRADWNGVFAEMEEALKALSSSTLERIGSQETRLPTPSIPVSWGELIDKITILEIRVQKTRPSAARDRIERELARLSQAASVAIAANPALKGWKRELALVNDELWTAEDRCREKEKAQCFDQEFIAIARSIYKLNDRRSAIKKQINLAFASEFIEEKNYSAY